MRHLENRAWQQCITRLLLFATVSAVDFYRQIGHAIVDEAKEAIGESRISMILMVKTLK